MVFSRNVTHAVFMWVLMLSGCSSVYISGTKKIEIAKPVNLPFRKVLPGHITDYEIMRADSRWGHEYFLTNSTLDNQGLKIENKIGRSCAEDKPWLMIRNTKTMQGLAILLAYSGNWRINVNSVGDNTQISASTIPQSLKPFTVVEDLPVPGAVVADFYGDWDNGSQQITRFIRSRLERRIDNNWPWVMYNTWYDRNENLEEKHLLESVDVAARLGCELFVIDAGWYGADKNQDWSTALGDWSVNRQRLPNGIEPIAQQVRRHGMKFGMWVEIECANPASPVGKEHPEWFLRYDDKLASPRSVLDFGNPQVLAWAIRQIDTIVDTYKIDYIKMDFNSHLNIDNENYSNQTDPLYRHYCGLIRLWQHMRRKYPDLVIENCSSGSLRYDLMAASFADTHWVSDEVSNNANLAMNFGATYLYPPETCNHWTVYPNASDSIDLQTCFTISMMGQMGLSGDIVKWDEQTRKIASQSITQYKKLRDIIRNSDIYHLTEQVDPKSPKSIQAVQYLDRVTSRCLVMVFHGGAQETMTVLKLKDLIPERSYRVEKPDAFGEDFVASGEELMQGLQINFPHKGSSAVIRIFPAVESIEKVPTPANVTCRLLEEKDVKGSLMAKIEWKPVSNTGRYIIYRAEGDKELKPYDEVFTAYYLATGLKLKQAYKFAIQAKTSNASKSEISQAVSIEAN